MEVTANIFSCTLNLSRTLQNKLDDLSKNLSDVISLCEALEFVCKEADRHF